MSLETCSFDHIEIVYSSEDSPRGCPFCAEIEELKETLAESEEKVIDLEKKVEDLGDVLYEIHQRFPQTDI